MESILVVTTHNHNYQRTYPIYSTSEDGDGPEIKDKNMNKYTIQPSYLLHSWHRWGGVTFVQGAGLIHRYSINAIRFSTCRGSKRQNTTKSKIIMDKVLLQRLLYHQ